MFQQHRNPIRPSAVSALRGLLLAGALTVTATALAADAPPPPPGPPDGQCNCRGGEMDLAKMKERAAQEFAAADTNHDGKISLDEFLAYKPQRGPGGPGGPGHMGMGMRMGMMGGGWMGDDHGAGGPDNADWKNADWKKEHDAHVQQFQSDLFKALDTDHNGQISQAEWAKAPDVVPTVMKKEMFARLDKNHDGYLTKDEFPPFVQKLAKLQAMDTNHDGKVSPDEMKAARAAKGAQTSPSTPSN